MEYLIHPQFQVLRQLVEVCVDPKSQLHSPFSLFHSFLSKVLLWKPDLSIHFLSSSCFFSEARERETLISDAKTQPLGKEESHKGVCTQNTGSQPLLQQRQIDSSILQEDLIKSQCGAALVQHSGSVDQQCPIVACHRMGGLLRNGHRHIKVCCYMILAGKKKSFGAHPVSKGDFPTIS